MPRLSVDIDLTFLPITDRDTALTGITEGLATIGEEIQRTIPQVRIQSTGTNAPKLQVATPHARIKVEPSPISRGCLFPPVEHELCQTAQDEYELFVRVQRLATANCMAASYARRSTGSTPVTCLTSDSFSMPVKFPMTSDKPSLSTLPGLVGPWRSCWHRIPNPLSNSTAITLRA